MHEAKWALHGFLVHLGCFAAFLQPASKVISLGGKFSFTVE
jgi:hypothetical protein